MSLLSEEELVWSPVVANCSMNRERKASGINSYEQEFKFNPAVLLESSIHAYGHSSWLDLCCGKGNALTQIASHFTNKRLQDKIELKGIDLLDTFDHHIGVSFETISLRDWIPDRAYDLITCAHGLHYIGDKLKIIEKALSSLTPSGLFIANMDINNIHISNENRNGTLKNVFRKLGIEYNVRTKILKHTGFGNIAFPFKYLGADDTTGPNYTGQPAVTSYYEPK